MESRRAYSLRLVNWGRSIQRHLQTIKRAFYDHVDLVTGDHCTCCPNYASSRRGSSLSATTKGDSDYYHNEYVNEPRLTFTPESSGDYFFDPSLGTFRARGSAKASTSGGSGSYEGNKGSSGGVRSQRKPYDQDSGL